MKTMSPATESESAEVHDLHGKAPVEKSKKLLSTHRLHSVLVRARAEAGRIVSRSGARPTLIKPQPEQGGRGPGGWLVGSFSLFVLLPTLLAFIYYALFASPVYVAEVKLTVREASRSDSRSVAQSILGSIRLGSASQGTGQDTMMVLDYLKSRAAIHDVGGVPMLERWYGNKEVDWLSRLQSHANLEESWDYWKQRVTASVDTVSNILTMRVRAYSPEDALEISRRIVSSSEKLVNDISVRRRADALTRAASEVEKAGADLADVRALMLDFQKRTGSLDPLETAKVIISSISALTSEKIAIETRLATATSTGVGARPGAKYDQARLAAVDEQLRQMNDRLTGTEMYSISAQLREYELIKLKEEFAEKIYTLSRSSYEDARREIEKKQLYVALIVPGVLPESALYPRVLVDSSLVSLGCLIIWAIVSLILATLRDSMI